MSQTQFELDLKEVLERHQLKYQTVNYGENRIDGLGWEDSKRTRFLANQGIPDSPTYDWRKDTYDGRVVCLITTRGLFGTGLFAQEVAQVFGLPEGSSISIEGRLVKRHEELERKLESVVDNIKNLHHQKNITFNLNRPSSL